MCSIAFPRPNNNHHNSLQVLTSEPWTRWKYRYSNSQADIDVVIHVPLDNFSNDQAQEIELLPKFYDRNPIWINGTHRLKEHFWSVRNLETA